MRRLFEIIIEQDGELDEALLKRIKSFLVGGAKKVIGGLKRKLSRKEIEQRREAARGRRKPMGAVFRRQGRRGGKW